jgi:hypothetical protein
MIDYKVLDHLFEHYKIENKHDLTNEMEGFAHFLKEENLDFSTTSTDVVQKYIDSMIESNQVTVSVLLLFARYFYLIDNKNVYIHFTKILGGLGVIENILKRVDQYVELSIAKDIRETAVIPPLGTSPLIVPEYTEKFMNLLKSKLDQSLYRKVLTGNNHGIPKEVMLSEKEEYEKSESLDQYLAERHQRKVLELQDCCDEDKVWFEQIITQDVVDFVASNQEILSAKRDGNKLYITKIPYDTKAFVEAGNDLEKRYYACHCPFARENVLTEKSDIDSDWCYCSAGFAKFPFEVILDQELEVKVLESALAGDMLCRFEVSLDHINYK